MVTLCSAEVTLGLHSGYTRVSNGSPESLLIYTRVDLDCKVSCTWVTGPFHIHLGCIGTSRNIHVERIGNKPNYYISYCCHIYTSLYTLLSLCCAEVTPRLHLGYTWVAQSLPFFKKNRLAYSCLPRRGLTWIAGFTWVTKVTTHGNQQCCIEVACVDLGSTKWL